MQKEFIVVLLYYSMTPIKTIIGITAVLLTFVGYIPYFRDIFKGKTIPHVYSWFLWGFVTFIAFALQVSDNAGPGAFVSFAAAIMCSGVFLLGIQKKGQRDITFSDKIFLLLAFISLLAWLVAKQPVVSVLLVTLTDLLGFAPTIRKSWDKPYTETLSFYLLNTFRFSLAVASLSRYTIVTTLYPLSWLLANGLFAFMLIVRRRQLQN